jgi:hypothetical protein
MFFGEIEHSFANAAFGLQDDLLANIVVHMDGVREYRFAFSGAVNIRVIEEVRFFVHCRLHEALGLRRAQRVNTHAADGDDGHV